MTRALPILRYLVLFAIAAFGVDGLVDSLGRLDGPPRGQAGFWLCGMSLALALLILWNIRKGRLPLRTWYILPFVLGAGAGFMAYEFAGALLGELDAAFTGFAVGLVSLPCLQVWADRLGGRDWYFVLVPLAAFASFPVIGLLQELL